MSKPTVGGPMNPVLKQSNSDLVFMFCSGVIIGAMLAGLICLIFM